MRSSTVESPISTESRQARPSTVLAFAAPLEAGKTTVSTAVAQKLNAPRVSFGSYLRKVAQEQGLPVTRESLQNLGEEMVRQDVRAFCTSVLQQETWQPDSPLIIDGVRHEEVLETLKELLDPPFHYLIFINVDRSTQEKRLKDDDLPHEKSLEELEQHSTEVQVRNVLPDRADLILDGTLPVPELVDKVIEFIKQPHIRDDLRTWDQKNKRRIELAKKKNREGLTNAEIAEFDQLQAGYFEYLNAKYPRETVDMSKLEEIEARLRSTQEPNKGS